MKILKIFFAMVIFLGFSLLTFLLNIDGFNELSILTGFIALLGIIMLFMGKKQADTGSAQVIQPSQSARSESLPIVDTWVRDNLSAAEQAKIPEDSVLRRHHISHLKSLREQQGPSKSVEPEAPTVNAARTIQSVVKEEVVQPVFNEAAEQQVKKDTTKSKIPEDSVLRRHFISHIRSLIENEMSNRPTDSVLKRHYETLVNTELENRLAKL